MNALRQCLILFCYFVRLLVDKKESKCVPDCSLDDVMMETKDEGESSIRLELVRILIQH